MTFYTSTTSLSFVIGYLLGGLTLFPVLLAIYIYVPCLVQYCMDQIQRFYQRYLKYTITSSTHDSTIDKTKGTGTSNNNNNNKQNSPLYKVGWLRMTHQTPVISLKKPSQRPFFAVLKHHTLYLYDSDKQLDCQQVLSLEHYQIQMYPPDIQDAEMFSRPYWIQLVSLQQQQQQQQQEQESLYLHCHLCTEKEDWYQVLLQASGRPRVPVTMGSLQPLIQRIHSDGDQLELQWFNALLGRLFLGLHQTERFRQAIWTKVLTKVDKINARRPPFLGEIQVRSVDLGGNLPLLTQPRLVLLTPQGECKLEAMIDYASDLHIEIATVLQWSYSERLPPLTMDIVLRVKLQSLKGKINILIKPPPSNRLWYGFEGLPEMKWHIAPLVWETKVGHSMVVKAIIKHLEEVFKDTMVLPHMDDITFFDANGLGGIYQSDEVEEEEKQKQRHQQQQQQRETVEKERERHDGLSQSDEDMEIDYDKGEEDAFADLEKTAAAFAQCRPSTSASTVRSATTILQTSSSPPPVPPVPPIPPLQQQSTSSPTTTHYRQRQRQEEEQESGGKKGSGDRRKTKKSSSAKSEPLPISAEKLKNNKKLQKKERKAKQQEDMELLSTARSLPELISAHTSSLVNSTTVPGNLKHNAILSSSTSSSTTTAATTAATTAITSDKKYLSTSPNNHTSSLLSLLPPSPPSDQAIMTPSVSASTTAAAQAASCQQQESMYHTSDVASAKSGASSISTSTSSLAPSSPPALRPRRSLAHLNQQQKTSASTAVAQVNTAAGLFLGKQPPLPPAVPSTTVN